MSEKKTDGKEDGKVRVHLILNELIYAWARASMSNRGFDNLKEYVTHLIRSDTERQGLADHAGSHPDLIDLEIEEELTEAPNVTQKARSIREKINQKKTAIKSKI